MTNEEAVGYAVGALYHILKLEGKSHHVAQAYCETLAIEMNYLFDMKTEREAEQILEEVLYSDFENEIETL